MPLNEQQQAACDFILNNPGSLNLEAYAGTGKTYTIVNGLVTTIIEHGLGNVALMAFNKSAALEFEARLKLLNNPKYLDRNLVATGTVHSFGFQAWKYASHNKYLKVDGFKVRNIIDQYADVIMQENKPTISQMVSLAKQWAFGLTTSIDDVSQWKLLIDHFGIEANGNAEALIAAAIKVYKVSLSQDREVIDFDDMILAPLLHQCTLFQKDFVIIDEAQDTNPSRRALAFKMLKPITGRLVAVGDSKQAIYGFTGANSDSMDIIKQQLGSHSLPLSITYRCPKAVVAEAQKLVPNFTAHESAPEGIVRSITAMMMPTDYNENVKPEPEPWFRIELPGAEDVVLCRNTKPLIEQAHKLLAAGIGCRVEGRDIGEGLINLANRWKSIKTLDQLITRVEHFSLEESEKWLSKGQETKAQSITDKCETLVLICSQLISNGKTQVTDLVAFIRSLFGDTPDGEKPKVLTLSTIHKAKGREWNRVYLLDRAGTLPSKWCKKPWQFEQESNLLYVAITRSKIELIDIIV